IELGGGGINNEGFFNLDICPLAGVDIVADLNIPFELIPDNSISGVESHHCLEHITNLTGLMKELHSIVKPDGRIKITVPHFSNPYFYSDPTRMRFFGMYTMSYFASKDNQLPTRQVPSFYTEARFKIESINIGLMPRSILNRLRWPLLNRF